MKISVQKAPNGDYTLSFDDTTHTLSRREIKVLLMEAVKSLSPDAPSSASPPQEIQALAERLKAANDPGLQELITNVVDDDILIFLKSTENDTLLHAKLFDNMSEPKQTTLFDELETRFTDGVDETQLGEAVVRLTELTDQLQSEGVLEITL